MEPVLTHVLQVGWDSTIDNDFKKLTTGPNKSLKPATHCQYRIMRLSIHSLRERWFDVAHKKLRVSKILMLAETLPL